MVTPPEPTPDPPPEWGKLSEGQPYIFLALDLGRALSCADMGKSVRKLAHAIMERSYYATIRTKGRLQRDVWPDPQPVKLKFTMLADELGIARQNLYRAKDWLLESRVVFSPEKSTFTFNKAAHEWVNPTSGEPLLTPDDLKYCAEARTHLSSPVMTNLVDPAGDLSSPVMTNAGTGGEVLSSPVMTNGGEGSGILSSPVMTTATDLSSPVMTTGVGTKNPFVIARDDNLSSPVMTNHIEERAQEILRFCDSSSGDSPPLPPGDETRERQPKPDHSAAAESLPAPPQARLTRPIKPDLAALDELRGWSETFDPEGHVSRSIGQWSTSYPLDWIESAVARGMALPPDKIPRFANSILVKWWAKGEPYELPEFNRPPPPPRPAPPRKPAPPTPDEARAARAARKELSRKSLEGI